VNAETQEIQRGFAASCEDHRGTWTWRRRVLATVGPLFVLIGFAAASCLVIADSTLPSLQAERWVNPPALTPVALGGKVVLVDFWEYTCVISADDWTAGRRRTRNGCGHGRVIRS